jgi:muconolactone delta-isomerase
MMTGLSVAVVMSGIALTAPDARVPDKGQVFAGVQLISGGRPACAIIYPSEDEVWRRMAARVAERIASLGVSGVRMLPDTQAVPERLGPLREDLQAISLILMGDLNSNRAIFPHYANYYTCCDARYPGDGGYELRTIVRPFGVDKSCLIVGAAKAADGEAAIESLTEMIRGLKSGPDVELPYILRVKPGKEVAGLFEPAVEWLRQGGGARPFEKESPYSLMLDQFTYAAHLYFYTGDETFARRAREAILQLVDREPEKARTGDYAMENLAAAWRRVCMCPVFSLEERARVDRALYGTAAEQSKAWWRLSDGSKGIGCRHHTTGMLAWWTLIRVLQEVGHLDAEAREQLHEWRGEAEEYLNGLRRHYADDQDDYQSIDSVQNTASYCLQTGDLAWYRNGLADRAARKLLSITDNRGWYAGIQGYGEALPGWERFTLNGGLLLGSCAFVYSDGAYDQALGRLASLGNSWGSLQPAGIHQFAGPRLVGPARARLDAFMDVLRLTPYRLDLLNAGDFLNSPLMDGYAVTGIRVPHVSSDLAFDKVVIRGLLPESVYLLLQGFSGTSLSTIDMNSIIRYGDLGKLWLVHNTGRRSLYFKNGVHVSSGIDEIPAPAACELLDHASFGDVAMVASRLPDYRGTDWTRHVFVLSTRFTLVLDHLRIDKPGRYMACCNWRTPGFASLEEATWKSVQDDAFFTLTEADPGNSWSRRSPIRDGATRPTTLRQRRVLDARGGEELFFANLIQVSGPDRPGGLGIRRVAPNAVMVASWPQGGSPAAGPVAPAGASLVAADRNGIELGSLKTDATMLILNTEGAWLAGGTSLRLQSETFAPEAGRISAKGSWTNIVASLLAGLCRKEVPREQEPRPRAPSVADAPSPVWTLKIPGSRGGLVDGVQLVAERHVSGPSILATDWILPLLRAEPRLQPGTSGGFDLRPPESRRAARPSASSMLAEVTLAPLKDSSFRLVLPEASTISEITLFGESAGEDAPSLTPAELVTELTFSGDGFNKDLRTRTVRAWRQPTHHALYKGHDYVFETYQLAGLNEHAREVRVHVVDGPTDEMPLSEVHVRTAGAGGVQPVQTRAIDLDGDGSDEILAWTPEGELAVARADGSPLWHKSWAEGVVTVDAWDLEDDGHREVFVSRSDRRVDVLNLDGSPRWHRDFSRMRQETGERLYGDGSLVYGMVAWRPEGAAEKQVLCASYFFSATLDAQGRLQKYFRRSGHHAGIREVPRRFAADGQFAIRCDIPWVGPVPLEWWDGKADEAVATCNVPNGPLVHFELDDFDVDGRVEALLASEEGIGLYGRTEPAVKWQHSTDAPCVGAAAVKVDDGHVATFIYGREDGYVFAVGADGRVINSTLLDEPLTCLTALCGASGQVVVLAGTRASLRCLRADDLSEMWRRAGSYVRLGLFSIRGTKHVLAIRPDGTMDAFMAFHVCP